jgi:putative acetyltransferase
MVIRDEYAADLELIHSLHCDAFGTSAEADLVAKLRNVESGVSLILEEGMRLVGHIMLTPVSLVGSPEIKLMGLGPMAIVPDRQRCGFGSALVEEGLVRCRANDCGAVIVLGHPGFYQHFDFVPASQYGINCKYDVPADVFMLLELTPGYLEQHGGSISYHAAFDNL